jgi:hypothetical protein
VRALDGASHYLAEPLQGPSDVASNDVWAVGESPESNAALIEQFNGTSWNLVSAPTIGNSDVLFGVSGLSANDGWAVGRYIGPSTDADRTLTEHWDGTS